MKTLVLVQVVPASRQVGKQIQMRRMSQMMIDIQLHSKRLSFLSEVSVR